MDITIAEQRAEELAWDDWRTAGEPYAEKPEPNPVPLRSEENLKQAIDFVPAHESEVSTVRALYTHRLNALVYYL